MNFDLSNPMDFDTLLCNTREKLARAALDAFLRKMNVCTNDGSPRRWHKKGPDYSTTLDDPIFSTTGVSFSWKDECLTPHIYYYLECADLDSESLQHIESIFEKCPLWGIKIIDDKLIFWDKINIEEFKTDCFYHPEDHPHRYEPCMEVLVAKGNWGITLSFKPCHKKYHGPHVLHFTPRLKPYETFGEDTADWYAYYRDIALRILELLMTDGTTGCD